jgi:hypothetical protein
VFILVVAHGPALVHLAEVHAADQEGERQSDNQVEPNALFQHDILLLSSISPSDG